MRALRNCSFRLCRPFELLKSGFYKPTCQKWLSNRRANASPGMARNALQGRQFDVGGLCAVEA